MKRHKKGYIKVAKVSPTGSMVLYMSSCTKAPTHNVHKFMSLQEFTHLYI